MWFDPARKDPDWKTAAKHLVRVDATLGKVITRAGDCMLTRRKDYFVALCKAIFSQQLSVKVAAVLFGRFRDQFPSRRPTPERTLKLLNGDPETIRKCGFSRQKAVYVRDLAQHFVDGRIPTRKLSRMSDQEVIDALVAVNGIGRWTAEMFLMFVLNRPDVLPVDDLGLREGVREIYQLSERPTAAEVTELAECWRPYRSIATWYVWRRGPAIAGRSAKSVSSPSVLKARAATRRRSRIARRKS